MQHSLYTSNCQLMSKQRKLEWEAIQAAFIPLAVTMIILANTKPRSILIWHSKVIKWICEQHSRQLHWRGKCIINVLWLSKSCQMSAKCQLHGHMASTAFLADHWSFIADHRSPITDHRPLIDERWSMYADRWMLEAVQTLDMAICDWSGVDLDFQATISKMS